MVLWSTSLLVWATPKVARPTPLVILTTDVELGSALRVVVTMLGFEMFMPTMVLVLLLLRMVFVTNGELLITPVK